MLLKVFRNSMGRLETRDEAAAVKALIGEFIASEYKMQDLLSHIVLSPAFRLVGAPK
jgi:hypothetical protein